MGACCNRHGQTIIPDVAVAKMSVYSAAASTLTRDLQQIQSRCPVAQQVVPKMDEQIEAPNISNPSLNESFNVDEPIEAPYKLDFSTAQTDLQKEGILLQEKRQVVSQCSIVSIQRLTSPLSYRKESESSFDSEVEAEDMVGSVIVEGMDEYQIPVRVDRSVL